MTHIVRRSMSLLLSVLFCLSLAAMPVLAIEDTEDTPTNTVTELTESTGDTNGETPQETTEPTEPTEPAPQEGAEQNQPVSQEKGPQENGTQNGEAVQGDEEEDNNSQEGEEENPAVPATPTALPTDFFTSVQIGQGYDQESGKILPFGEDVPMDGACALRFDYKIPENANFQPGRVYTFSAEAPLKIDGTETLYVMHGSVQVAKVTIQNDTTDHVSGTFEFLSDIDSGYYETGNTGHFYVGAHFIKEEHGTGGKQTVTVKIEGTEISDSVKVDFAVPEVTANVTLKKEANSVTNLEDKIVNWTLTVTPSVKGLAETPFINSLVVTDNLKEQGLSYVDGSATASADCTFDYDEETGILTFTGSEEALKASSWPITITFQTHYTVADVQNLYTNGKIRFNNEATAKITAPKYVKDSDGKVTLTDSTADAVQIEKSAKATASAEVACLSLTKKGALESGRHVNWTVEATNHLNLSNPTITDTLPAHMLLDEGSVKLNDQTLGKDDYTLEKNAAGNYVLTVPLKAGTEKQTLTYTTTFDNTTGTASETTEYTNKAEFTAGTDGTEGTKGVSITKKASIHVGNQMMTKSGTYHRETHTIDWKVKLTSTGRGLTDIVFQVVFGQSINGQDVKQTLVEGSFKVIDTSKVTDSSEGQEVALADGAFTPYEDGTGFTLKIRNNHPVTEELRYTTVLDDSAAAREFWGSNYNGNFQVENTITLTAKGLEAQAIVTAKASGTSKMLTKEFVSYDYANKLVNWKLTANQNNMALTNATITDTLNDNNWMFADETHVKVMQGSTDVTGQCKITFNNEVEKPVMTIRLPEHIAANEGQLVITYCTTPKDASILLTNQKLDVQNEAVLNASEVKNGGVSDTASATIGQNVLNKTSSALDQSTHQLTWTVDINRNMATIAAKAPYALGIEDTLQEGLSYVEGSLEIYELTTTPNGGDGTVTLGKKLTEGEDYAITYDTASRKLLVTWKDQTELTKAYRMTFRTLVMVSGTYSNTVSFVGVDSGSWQNSGASSRRVVFSGGATSLPEGLGALLIQKTDGNNAATKLKDAKFTIKNSNGESLGTFLTDENGEIHAALPVGDYVVEEVEAPAGYLLSTVHSWKVTIVKRQECKLPVVNYRNEKVALFAPAVTKAIKGSGAPKDTVFTFRLAPVGTAPMPARDTVTITGEGTADFGSIQYTEAGEYQYTITEEDGKAYRYTYDTKPHTLTVTVAEVGGQLTATAKYDTDQDSLTITNTYKRPSGGGGTVTPDPKPDPKPDPDPDQPTEPTEPDQPTEPTDPDQPTEPGEPDQPSTPEQPDTPSTPSRPSRPSIPQYPIDRLPDPSDPSSPDEIIIIDDDDVPLGNFYKEKEPDGSYAYVDKKGNMYGRTMPKGTKTAGHTPKTGVPMTVPALAVTGGLCAVGGAVLCFGGKKNKEDE